MPNRNSSRPLLVWNALIWVLANPSNDVLDLNFHFWYMCGVVWWRVIFRKKSSTGQLNKRTAPVASLSAQGRSIVVLAYERRPHPPWQPSPVWQVYCSPPEPASHMHNGHQGIQRCRQCTALSVWQPGVSKHIEQLVKLCPNCAKASTHVGPTLSKL